LLATRCGHSTWHPFFRAERRRFARNSVWAFHPDDMPKSAYRNPVMSPSRSDFGEKTENRKFPRSASCQNTSQPTRSTCSSDPPESADRDVSRYYLERHPAAAFHHFTSRGAPRTPALCPVPQEAQIGGLIRLAALWHGVGDPSRHGCSWYAQNIPHTPQ
jgi:hypothetical protein